MKISPHAVLACVCSFGLAFFAAPRDSHAQLVQKSISYENGTRVWFEHVPVSYDGSKAVPLVIVLHGAHDSGDDFAPRSEWPSVSDANGFISIFPNGEGSNNSLVWASWAPAGYKPDDIGFLLQVITQVEATYKIDASRIYMTGFSNGGGMTSFFAAAHPELLAAIAPLSAGWITNTGVSDSTLHPTAPMPAWVWRGAQDNTSDTPSVFTQDMQQTAFWVHLDGDAITPRVATVGTDTDDVYTGGQAEVRFTSVSDMGHDIQTGSAARIWAEFFSRFARSGKKIRSGNLPAVKVSATVPKASAIGAVNGIFLLSRDGGPASALTVGYQMDGTAVGGVDYKALPGSVVLPEGAVSTRIKVRPKPVADASGKKTVRLTLVPGDDYILSDSSAAKVKIVEDR